MDLGTGDELLNNGAVMGLKGVLQCEPPNANLHQFQGRFEAGMPNKAIPCESVLARQQADSQGKNKGIHLGVMHLFCNEIPE